MIDNYINSEMQKDIQKALMISQSALQKIEEQNLRIQKLEDLSSILHEMNTNLQVMVEQNHFRDEKVENLGKTICEVKSNIQEIKDKPLVNFEKGKWIVITMVITSITAFILSQIPALL